MGEMAEMWFGTYCVISVRGACEVCPGVGCPLDVVDAGAVGVRVCAVVDGEVITADQAGC
jgi:hypothetical protein